MLHKTIYDDLIFLIIIPPFKKLCPMILYIAYLNYINKFFKVLNLGGKNLHIHISFSFSMIKTLEKNDNYIYRANGTILPNVSLLSAF